MTISAFLPCRTGSQRVPDKDTRSYAHCGNGLPGADLDWTEDVMIVAELWRLRGGNG
jgi:hypothetical protein